MGVGSYSPGDETVVNAVEQVAEARRVTMARSADWKMLAEALDDHLVSAQQPCVATILEPEELTRAVRPPGDHALSIAAWRTTAARSRCSSRPMHPQEARLGRGDRCALGLDWD
jgi:hypothetical protein